MGSLVGLHVCDYALYMCVQVYVWKGKGIVSLKGFFLKKNI